MERQEREVGALRVVMVWRGGCIVMEHSVCVMY